MILAPETLQITLYHFYLGLLNYFFFFFIGAINTYLAIEFWILFRGQLVCASKIIIYKYMVEFYEISFLITKQQTITEQSIHEQARGKSL